MSTVPGTVGLGEWSPLTVIPARGREGKGRVEGPVTVT